MILFVIILMTFHSNVFNYFQYNRNIITQIYQFIIFANLYRKHENIRKFLLVYLVKGHVILLSQVQRSSIIDLKVVRYE